MFFLIAISACKKKPNPEEEVNPNSFDQKSMFENYSTNLIIPAYNLLKVKVDSLSLHISTFNSSTTTTSLSIVRSSFISA